MGVFRSHIINWMKVAVICYFITLCGTLFYAYNTYDINVRTDPKDYQTDSIKVCHKNKTNIHAHHSNYRNLKILQSNFHNQ